MSNLCSPVTTRSVLLKKKWKKDNRESLVTAVCLTILRHDSTKLKCVNIFPCCIILWSQDNCANSSTFTENCQHSETNMQAGVASVRGVGPRPFDDVIKWKHFPRYWPFVRGIHRSPVRFDIFFDLRLNKRLRKQSWGWWFETLSHPLWRHCNIALCDIITGSDAICVPRRHRNMLINERHHWWIQMVIKATWNTARRPKFLS